MSQTYLALLFIGAGVCFMIFYRAFARGATKWQDAISPRWWRRWPLAPPNEQTEKGNRIGYLVVGAFFVVFGLLFLFRVAIIKNHF